MSGRAPAFRTILRSTTAFSSPTAQIPWTFSQHQLRKSQSPPPPYQARNITIAAPTSQWTRFRTTTTYSSIRSFTAGPSSRWPSDASIGSATSPQAAQKIEEAIELIQELYGTARDEFEIAAEETEKNTTYAPDDRAAAREELDKLLKYYGEVLEGPEQAVAEEVKRRVGQRIRELEQAVIALEEQVMHGD